MKLCLLLLGAAAGATALSDAEYLAQYGAPHADGDTPTCELVDGRTIVHYNYNTDLSFKCTHNADGTSCTCTDRHPTHHTGRCIEFDHLNNEAHAVAAGTVTRTLRAHGACDDTGLNTLCDTPGTTCSCTCSNGDKLTGDACRTAAEAANSATTEACGACDAGYSLDANGACADDDECADDTHNCASGYACSNTAGSFECNDVDECATNNGDCGAGYTCANSAGSFACNDIDECADGSHNCGAGYNCLNNDGGYTCPPTCNECPVLSIQHGHTGSGPGNGMYAHFSEPCMQRITGGFGQDTQTYLVQMRNGAVYRKGLAQVWTTANNGGGGLGDGYGHLRWCADGKTAGVDTFSCSAGDFQVGDSFVTTDLQASVCGSTSDVCRGCPVVSTQHGHTGSGTGSGTYAHFAVPCMQQITGGYAHDQPTWLIQIRNGAVYRSGYAQAWTSANNGGGGLGDGYGHLRWCADGKTAGVDTYSCSSGDFQVGDTFVRTTAQANECLNVH